MNYRYLLVIIPTYRIRRADQRSMSEQSHDIATIPMETAEPERTLSLRQRVFERVDSIRDNTVAPKSRFNYNYSMIRFLCWLYEHEEDVLGKSILTDAFKQGVSGSVPSKDYVASFLAREFPHPIQFDRLTASDFVAWIAYLQDSAESEGQHLSGSTLSGHRAGNPISFATIANKCPVN